MQNYNNKALVIESGKITPDTVTWKCPSNIALIKYWGKYGKQLPKNPSISFTLNNAYTETSISYRPGDSNKISFDFYFNGVKREDFKPKIQNLLTGIIEIYPFLEQLHLTINSSNSFPHSTGIASSASSMGAIALCLCTIEEKLFGITLSEDAFIQKASYIARIGSGSACRSLYEIASAWGEIADIQGSSNYYGIAVKDMIHPVFHAYHDDILIVSKEEKAVSSTIGHGLMDNNIYAENRYIQAKNRLHSLLPVMKTGDLESFCTIVEDEALTLHALMMTSNPSFLLMRPDTLSIIEKIKAFRHSTKIPLCFTLDAGPNVHVLYPDNFSEIVGDFISNKLSQHCSNFIIRDKVGKGPEFLA